MGKNAATPTSDGEGFTLIELSIVLVIIGLIVGGVLVGQDLIHAAEIRQTISQKESYDAAVNTFVGKYNCTPGDCANATQFGLGSNGNGDGLIGGVNASVNSDEYKLFWLHLYNAGLLKSTQAPGSLFYGGSPTVTGYHSPTCPICRQISFTWSGSTVMMGGWGVQQLQNYTTLNCEGVSWTSQGGQLPSWNAFLLIDSGGLFGGGGYSPQLNAAEAYAIDAKIDDGLPLTGSVLAIGDWTYSAPACSGNSSLPALSMPCGVASGQYVTSTTGACMNLIMRASF